MTDEQIKQRAAEIYQKVCGFHNDRRTDEGNAMRAIAIALREGMAMRVPEERPVPAVTAAMSQYNNGWNACRAAMIKETGNG